MDEMVSENRAKLKKSSSKNKVEADDLYRDSAQYSAEGMALTEFKSSKAKCKAKRDAIEAKQREEREERENLERSKAEGTMRDCECCFGDYPINRMVHCDGPVAHFFCRECAKQQAATLIGLQKCELTCMSMDNCPAGFSLDQKNIFLDDKLKLGLELIEQERAVRDIPGLARCPFCRYAEEYPPVEENKVFVCKNPDCEISSCRICEKESHLPKSCEEVAREKGDSARRILEEARSRALIRKCNHCKS